jgi:hypothetical protein
MSWGYRVEANAIAKRGGVRLISKQPADFETDTEGTPMKELTHFTDGKHVRGISGRFGDGFEPMTGEVISRAPLASKAEVRTAVKNAIAAQPARAATNPQRPAPES